MKSCLLHCDRFVSTGVSVQRTRPPVLDGRGMIRFAAALLVAVWLGSGAALRRCEAAATETDASQSFPQGSTGYQSMVPSAATNILAGVMPVSTGNVTADSNTNNTTVSTNLATLTDGSFGLVPASGGDPGPGRSRLPPARR